MIGSELNLYRQARRDILRPDDVLTPPQNPYPYQGRRNGTAQGYTRDQRPSDGHPEKTGARIGGSH